MLYIRNLFGFFFLFPALFSSAQTGGLSKLDSLAGALISKIRVEKKEQLYVTTDRSIYAAGEAVWFRAFLLNDASQKVSRQSQTVFIDLVNEKNNVVYQSLLHADLQQLQGRLLLPDTLTSGYYWVRAYTKNMQSQDTGNFAEQPVYIYNQNQKAKKANVSAADEVPQLNFYPEGGSLITRAPSLVAVRITGKNDNPIADSVIIKDDHDLLIAKFATDKYGLGRFQFTPYHYKKYIASIHQNGKEYTYPLPPFNSFAGQVSVSPQKDGSKKLTVLLEDSIFRNDFQTYLIGVSKDSLCFASIGSGNYELSIPADKLPPGIITFFLFDKNVKLLSERNIYIKEGVTVKTEINKSVFTRRDKAIINISMANAAGLPVTASFSISVTEDHFIKSIEKDGRYLSDWPLSEDNDLTGEEADLLMLTKNNVYRNIMSYASISAPATGNDSLLYISGTLKDKNNNPLPDKIILLSSKTNNNLFETDTTDDHGRFCFPFADYPNGTMFTLQSLKNTGNPENWKAELDTFKFPGLATTGMHRRKFTMQAAAVAKYMDSSFFETGKVLLQPVEVKGRKQDEADYDKSKRVSPFSYVVTGKELDNSGTSAAGNAVLSVPGSQISNGFLVFGGLGTMHGADANSEPMILVDGSTIDIASQEDKTAIPGINSSSGTSPVLSYLNSLDSRTIDFIEVLSGPQTSAYGVRGANGVILINTTNKHRENDMDRKGSILKTFFAKGYQEPPLFTMPAYDSKKPDQPKNADLRSTVYWNGNILTDKDGKAMVTFYTNDVPGNYTVTIRGITAHGYVVYKTISYELK